jgi:hypothetical protein
MTPAGTVDLQRLSFENHARVAFPWKFSAAKIMQTSIGEIDPWPISLAQRTATQASEATEPTTKTPAQIGATSEASRFSISVNVKMRD